MGKIPIWCRTYTATWTHKGQLSWLWVSKRNNTRRMSCLPDLSQGCVLSHRMYHHVLLLIILFYTLFEYELLVVGLGLGGVFLFVVFFHVQEWDVIVASLNLLERNRKIKQTNLLFTNYSTADIPLWYFGTVLFYAISKLFFCFGVSVLIKWLHRSGYSLHYQLSSLVSTSDSFCQRGYSVNFVLIYKWSFFHPIAVQTTFTLVCDCS